MKAELGPEIRMVSILPVRRQQAVIR